MIIGYSLYNTYLGALLRLLLWTDEWSDFENLHVHLEIVERDIQNRHNRYCRIMRVVQIVYSQTSFTSVQTISFWKVIQNVLLGWWSTELLPVILSVLVVRVLHSDVICIDQDFCIFFLYHLCHYIHCMLTFGEFLSRFCFPLQVVWWFPVFLNPARWVLPFLTCFNVNFLAFGLG